MIRIINLRKLSGRDLIVKSWENEAVQQTIFQGNYFYLKCNIYFE